MLIDNHAIAQGEALRAGSTRTLKGRLVRREINGISEKLCGGCNEWKPLDDDHFQFIKTTGVWQCYCRPCLYAKAVARAQARRKAA